VALGLELCFTRSALDQTDGVELVVLEDVTKPSRPSGDDHQTQLPSFFRFGEILLVVVDLQSLSPETSRLIEVHGRPSAKALN